MGQFYGGGYNAGAAIGGAAANLAQYNKFGAGMSYSSLNRGVISGGTIAIDVRASSSQKLTVGGVLAISFTNWDSNDILTIVQLEITNPGAFTTSFTNVTWVNESNGISYTDVVDYLTSLGRVPAAFIAVGTERFVFSSSNGGTSIFGKLV